MLSRFKVDSYVDRLFSIRSKSSRAASAVQSPDIGFLLFQGVRRPLSVCDPPQDVFDEQFRPHAPIPTRTDSIYNQLIFDSVVVQESLLSQYRRRRQTLNIFISIIPNLCFPICSIPCKNVGQSGTYAILSTKSRNIGLELCRLPWRTSFTCCPAGGQVIWAGDMALTGSKEKTDIHDWHTACGNLRHQVQQPFFL